MRKRIVILSILVCIITTLVLCVTSLNDVNAVSLNEIEELYNMPTTNPNGNLIVEKGNINFNEGSHDWIENDDWDKDTLAMSYRNTGGDNPMQEIVPIGASTVTSFEVWFPSVNLDQAKGFMFYVDFSNLLDPTDLKLHMFVRTNDDVPTGNIGELEKRDFNANQDCYYFDYNLGEWVVSKTDSDRFFMVPDYFRGYVYLPIEGYNDIHNSGVGMNNKLVQMYHIDFSIKDNSENVASLYLDNIRVVGEGSSHTHNYQNSTTIEATCTQEGVNLFKCDCGQVKWENKTSKAPHTLGEKHHVSQNLAAALCEECGKLEYFNEEVNKNWNNPVTITYHYNHKGYESKTYQYPKGYMLDYNDIPLVIQIKEKYDIHQFFRFTTDEVGIYGKNPVEMVVNSDLILYAQYNFASAALQKYQAMVSDVSFNGGPYDEETYKGNLIYIGQSNFSLWHNMENWYKQKGIPARNNSIAGATSHNYVQFVEELILMYKPKIVVCIVSSNDLAYHQMSDSTIMNNMKEFYNIINTNLPETEVIFVSGNPLPGRNEYFTVIKRLNSKLEAFCNENDNTHFVDIYDITMGYVLDYGKVDSNGNDIDPWDTWTHLHEAELTHVMGEKVYEVMIKVIQDKGITFK